MALECPMRRGELGFLIPVNSGQRLPTTANHGQQPQTTANNRKLIARSRASVMIASHVIRIPS